METLNPKAKELAKMFYIELQAEYRKLKREGEPDIEEMLEQTEQGYKDLMEDKMSKYSAIFLLVFNLWLAEGTPMAALDAEAILN